MWTALRVSYSTNRIWFIKEYMTLRRRQGHKGDVAPPLSLIEQRAKENMATAETDSFSHAVEFDFRMVENEPYDPCNRDYDIDDDIMKADGDFDENLCEKYCCKKYNLRNAVPK